MFISGLRETWNMWKMPNNTPKKCKESSGEKPKSFFFKNILIYIHIADFYDI